MKYYVFRFNIHRGTIYENIDATTYIVFCNLLKATGTYRWILDAFVRRVSLIVKQILVS